MTLPNRPSQDTAVVRDLIRAFGLIQRHLHPFFSGFGISGAQWGVLRALDRLEIEGGGSEVRLSDLSERLLVQPPSVTGIVDRLEKMGFVKRVASTADRRARRVSLTKEGRELLTRVLKEHPKQVESVLGGLRAGERRKLGELLGKLTGHLEAVTTYE